MKKNDVFTCTAPNGVEVQAVVISEVAYEVGNINAVRRLICYAQNRLFTYEESHNIWHNEYPTEYRYGKVLVDYCILPDYDAMLERYSEIEIARTETNLGM